MSGSPATRGCGHRRARRWQPGRVSKHGAGDLPITKGLQECIRDFQGIDEDVELQPILDQLAARPRSTCPSARTQRRVSPPSWAD
jgi:hypothetical protein